MSTKNQLEIGINANVTGQESVADLTDRLDDMAKLLEGDLQNQAKEAAAELRNLAAQGAAIDAFNQLEAEAKNTAQALAKAKKEAADFGSQIAQAGPPTQQEAAALGRLQAQVQASTEKFSGQQLSIAQARQVLQSYGIAATQTGAAQQRIAADTEAVRQRVADLAPAYAKASGSASAAGQNIQRSHRAIADGVDSISVQLGRVQNAYLALQGGGQLGGMVKSALETADAFNSMAARIKLAAGEGAAFDAAMEGVQRIAVATRSDLEGTATLFTKLSEAGKTMGLGQQEVLRLTETINQAIQVSGGSADSAKAAITQLVQGLQGGALRGDEFNSVMEQSPRLARALADGLGVGTGELRKMAEQGRLTSEVVIASLQGQTDKVASEFAKLPPTVGGALQNLSTAWTVYVGETDKATGTSQLAAQAIGVLATNLSTIAGYLLDAGQAAAVFTALRLAQHFTGIGAAATASATAVAANATAMQATGAAATAAVATVGRFAAILATLRSFTLIGLVANFKDIGTWIGEGIAKLQGYKDKSVELEGVEKSAQARQQAAIDLRARQAAADKAAELALLGLSKQGANAVAQFEQLTKDGKSAAGAVAEIGKDFDLSKLPGIRDAATVLNALAAQGKVSATEFEVAWANALKGQDLAAFEVKAKAAFGNTAADAQQLAQITDQVLREAVRRVAPEYELLAGATSKAAIGAGNDTQAMIDGLDRLKAQGVDTAAALTASLGKGIDTANTQKAVEAVKVQIEAVRKVLGDKVADGLLDQAAQKALALAQALDKAKTGIQGAQEAMKALGITSDAELKRIATQSTAAFETLRSSGTGSTREIGLAWKKMTEDAIAANGGVATATQKAQAAMHGLRIEADATGRSIVQAMGQGAGAANRLSEVVKLTAAQVQANADAVDRLNMKYMQSSKYSENQIALLEKEAAAREKVNQVRKREIALENERRGVDAEGFSINRATGQRITQTVHTVDEVEAQLVAGGVHQGVARDNAARILRNQEVPSGIATFSGTENSRSIQQQITDLIREIGTRRAPTVGVAAKTYNVQIGARTVRTASDADAQALIGALKDARLSA